MIFKLDYFVLMGIVLLATLSLKISASPLQNPVSTNFKVCNKVSEKYIIKYHVDSSSDIVKKQPGYFKNERSEVLQGTNFSMAAFPSGNGFVNAVVEAYRGHHNLIIRPDDVWAAIMTQFSFYLNKHAEKFRNKFVNFEGKKELIVYLEGTLHTASYDLFVKAMTEKIGENLVDPQVKSWILPNFSTTTEDDYISIGVIFMSTLKSYFAYVGGILCGIPSITLEGTVEDWKNIQGRLEKLKEYELTDWYEMLNPILDEFVSAKEDNVNVDFWARICRVDHGRIGCKKTQYISGWITAFAWFTPKGDKQNSFPKYNKNPQELSTWPTIDVKLVPSGVVEVDVKIDDHGRLYNATMLAGHMAIEMKDDGFTLQPSVGWAIVL